MTAKQLMDSRKFCLIMDDLAAVWVKKRADEADKEFRLQAVLDHVNGAPMVAADNKPIHIEGKPAAEKKAELVAVDEAMERIKSDPAFQIIKFVKDNEEVLKNAQPRPDGILTVLFPNSFLPDMIAAVLDAHPELGLVVDGTEGISVGPKRALQTGQMASDTWEIPCRKR